MIDDKIKNIFNLDQKISSQLAFILLLVISFMIAFYVTRKGEEIIQDAKSGNMLKMEKRVPEELINKRN